jgi:hypothetical protein
MSVVAVDIVKSIDASIEPLRRDRPIGNALDPTRRGRPKPSNRIPRAMRRIVTQARYADCRHVDERLLGTNSLRE